MPACTCLCVCIYTYIVIHRQSVICMRVCIYIYIYIVIHRQSVIYAPMYVCVREREKLMLIYINLYGYIYR